MQPIEIIVIAITVLFMASLLAVYIYKKVKKHPIDTCGCGCHDKKKTKKMFDEIRNELALEENNNCNKCCNIK